MKVINWNISYAGDIERKAAFLRTFLSENVIVMLQEVKPHAYEYIQSILGEDYRLFYSLDYRSPSKFDSDARKLGVLIILNKKYEVLESGVINRSPFPDRTMYVTLQCGCHVIKVLALHSLTGCGYFRAKSVQYDSFAEFINGYMPDIIGIDANEPQVDHCDISQMQFFDNGPGAKHFFDEVVHIGLSDAFVQCNGTGEYEAGKPLTKSHSIRRRGAVRYDFVFVRNSYRVHELRYLYDEAVASGSDHAIIVGEFVLEG